MSIKLTRGNKKYLDYRIIIEIIILINSTVQIGNYSTPFGDGTWTPINMKKTEESR